MFLQQLVDYGNWEWVKGAFRNKKFSINIFNLFVTLEKKRGQYI